MSCDLGIWLWFQVKGRGKVQHKIEESRRQPLWNCFTHWSSSQADQQSFPPQTQQAPESLAPTHPAWDPKSNTTTDHSSLNGNTNRASCDRCYWVFEPPAKIKGLWNGCYLVIWPGSLYCEGRWRCWFRRRRGRGFWSRLCAGTSGPALRITRRWSWLLSPWRLVWWWWFGRYSLDTLSQMRFHFHPLLTKSLTDINIKSNWNL